MDVRELMTTEVLTASPETSLKDVAAILSDHRISGLPVCDCDGRVLGVVSEADVIVKEQGGHTDERGRRFRLVGGAGRGASPKHAARTAGEAMTSPAITITPDRPAAAAARIMLEHRIERLPVVHDGTLLGIVTRADLVRAFRRSDLDILAEIRQEVLHRAMWLDPTSVEVDVRDGEVELDGVLQARSDVEVLVKLVQRVVGVVAVRSTVRYRVDDLGRARRLAAR